MVWTNKIVNDSEFKKIIPESIKQIINERIEDLQGFYTKDMIEGLKKEYEIILFGMYVIGLDYIKLQKDKITDLEDELYRYNAGIVSLGWIGLKKKPTKSNIKYLNNLLGRTIKLLRELKDEK